MKEEIQETLEKIGMNFYIDYNNDTRPMTLENIPRIGNTYIRTEGTLIRLQPILESISKIILKQIDKKITELKLKPDQKNKTPLDRAELSYNIALDTILTITKNIEKELLAKEK